MYMKCLGNDIYIYGFVKWKRNFIFKYSVSIRISE